MNGPIMDARDGRMPFMPRGLISSESHSESNHDEYIDDNYGRQGKAKQ